MKNLVKLVALVSVVTLSIPSVSFASKYGDGYDNGYDSGYDSGRSAGRSDAQFDMSVSSSSSLMQLIYITSGDATSLSEDEDKVEIYAVKDDARAYIAGDIMTDGLAAVIDDLEAKAIDNGVDELIGNPERIALEILMFK